MKRKFSNSDRQKMMNDMLMGDMREGTDFIDSHTTLEDMDFFLSFNAKGLFWGIPFNAEQKKFISVVLNKGLGLKTTPSTIKHYKVSSFERVILNNVNNLGEYSQKMLDGIMDILYSK